jgi:hypothetical protein
LNIITHSLFVIPEEGRNLPMGNEFVYIPCRTASIKFLLRCTLVRSVILVSFVKSLT